MLAALRQLHETAGDSHAAPALLYSNFPSYTDHPAIGKVGGWVARRNSLLLAIFSRLQF